jgi:hypothetical protein
MAQMAINPRLICKNCILPSFTASPLMAMKIHLPHDAGLTEPSYSAVRSDATVVGLGEADPSAGYALDLSHLISSSLTPGSPSPATAQPASVRL